MVKIAASLVMSVSLLGAAAEGSEAILLDFNSPHCPPCRQMDPTIHSMQSVGYPIRKIDVTREPQLASRYGVTGVPCFVMLVGDQEVDRVVGATSRERLEAMFQRARDELDRQRAERIRTQSPDSPPQSASAYSQYAVGGGAPSGHAQPSPPASHDAPQTLDPQFAGLLSTAVRLRVEDGTGRSFGTGTIIDTRSGEALVITCGHLFRESQGQGPLTVELFDVTPAGPRSVAQVAGTVISYDLDRDIALVSIRPGRPMKVAPVAPPRTVVERGDRVVSIGCSNGDDPTVLATRITSIDRYQGPPNFQAAGAPVVGRSGGGLFNEQGQLIGVCFAADYEGNEGLYAALESIHSELERLGLSEIIVQPAEDAIPVGAVAAAAPTAMPPVVRGQEPLQPVMPVGGPPSVAPVAQPEALNAAEQAALEEILARAAECEVVCIIRPKEPGGHSEVITLDGVSQNFVRALTAARGDLQTAGVR